MKTAVGVLSSRVARKRLSADHAASPTPQRAAGRSGSGLTAGMAKGGCAMA